MCNIWLRQVSQCPSICLAKSCYKYSLLTFLVYLIFKISARQCWCHEILPIEVTDGDGLPYQNLRDKLNLHIFPFNACILKMVHLCSFIDNILLNYRGFHHVVPLPVLCFFFVYFGLVNIKGNYLLGLWSYPKSLFWVKSMALTSIPLKVTKGPPAGLIK